MSDLVIGTVTVRSEPDELDNRENHAVPYIKVEFPRGAHWLPASGQRVAVSPVHEAGTVTTG